MPSGPWKPHKLTQAQIRFLKAQEAKGKHLGFKNLANIIYTGELEEGRGHVVAARIAKRTAGMQAVRKGIHKGTRRQHIPVLR